jgi:hypothetical protein
MKINDWEKITHFTELSRYPVLPCPHCEEIQLRLDLENLAKRPMSDDAIEKLKRETSAKKPKEIDDPDDETEKVNKKFENKQQYIPREKNELSFAEEHPFLTILAVGAGLYLYDQVEQNHLGNLKPFQFTGFFECSSCKQSVTAAGMYIEKSSNNDKHHWAGIKVEYFSPTIPIIPVSDNVPEDIKFELHDAFKHFHFDSPSSASKLRRAIERFCEDLNAEGGNLHLKIKFLKDNHPEEVEYLMSLKLLGNEGTHANDVTQVDLLHAFEIFQFVLELYDRKARYQETQKNYLELTKKFNTNT